MMPISQTNAIYFGANNDYHGMSGTAGCVTRITIKGEVMRKIIIGLALATAGALGTGQAVASEYGCKVLLCMSNPSGPMAVQQCVPPIQQLIQEQAQKPPKPWPTCEEGAPATMRPQMRPYDACPAGTTALGSGGEVLQMSAAQFRANMSRPDPLRPPPQPGELPTIITYSDPVGIPAYSGIGEGTMENYNARQRKVCVPSPMGQLVVVKITAEEKTETAYPVYESIAIVERP